jgi:hypothetical protein
MREVAFIDIDRQNKQELRNVFQIKRGMKCSEINWSFTQAKKLSKISAIVFIVLLALVWPISTYYFSVWSAEYAAQTTLGIDDTWFAVIASNALVGACALVDTVAFEVIDRVFTKERFLKTHQRFGFKFLSLIFYTATSNLFYQIYGMVDGTDNLVYNKAVETRQFLLAKSVIDSTTMSIFTVILGALIFQIIVPIITYKIGQLKEPLEHDMTFGLSNIAILIFNLGFYAP